MKIDSPSAQAYGATLLRLALGAMFLAHAGLKVFTFTMAGTVQFFGSSIEHVPCVSLDEVFQAAAAGTADFGVVPVENNSEGVVTRSLDLLLQSPLHIVGEISLLVRHHLLRLSNSLDSGMSLLSSSVYLTVWRPPRMVCTMLVQPVV